MNKDRWLLPEGIAEVLPPQAQQLETLRRGILDVYRSWGYELVMPPFIEYLESLLVGTGTDLDLSTFKITDQMNGRMMGVRADLTPQVARIDAHQLKRNGPTRLCYMGTVLHTRPDGFAGSRSPLQIGAELYGHSGIESDLEIFELMIETLACCGIHDAYFDLGHVGIFRGLAQQAQLDAEQETELFDALQRKAKPEIQSMLSHWQLPQNVSTMLMALADLNGGAEVLDRADQLLADADAGVLSALQTLRQMAEKLTSRYAQLSLHYDLAELRGYNYHTGLVFAAFMPGQGQAIVQGGRYDGIGSAFGNARPATGFSADLKNLISLIAAATGEQHGILAPNADDPALREQINTLRKQGERVVVALPGQDVDAAALGCDRQLQRSAAGWTVKNI